MSLRTAFKIASNLGGKNICQTKTQHANNLPSNSILYNNTFNFARKQPFSTSSDHQHENANRRYSQVQLFSSIVHSPKKDREPSPVIIIHGLFGNSSNWRGIARKMGEKCPLEIHLVDLRNHGDSPHTDDMNHDVMVKDILQYLDDNKFSKVSIIGHSMGGRVAMKLALDHPDVIDKLVVVDVAPVTYRSFDKFNDYINWMKEVELPKIKSRRDADDYLRQYIPQYGLRQFLLTNLRDLTIPNPHSKAPRKENTTDSIYEWKINLDVLQQSLPFLRKFPNEPSQSKPFPGQTLFIGGGQSNYILPDYHSAMKSLFPNSHIDMLDGAGHWVHADKPDLFVEKAANFLCDCSEAK